MQIEGRAAEKAKQGSAGGRCGRHGASSAARPEMALRSSIRKYNSSTDLNRGPSLQPSRLDYAFDFQTKNSKRPLVLLQNSEEIVKISTKHFL